MSLMLKYLPYEMLAFLSGLHQALDEGQVRRFLNDLGALIMKRNICTNSMMPYQKPNAWGGG